MRKWLVIAAASVLVLVGAALLWPRSAPSSESTRPAASPAARALPEFAEVEVSSGEAEGLALTGRVLDPSGRPLPGAEVSLAASAQKTLTSVRCEECGQALLSCPANESAAHALSFFEQHHGFLTPRVTVRTDAQGRFRFEHLAGVSFSVWARAPGHGVAIRERAAPGEPVDLYLPTLRSISGQVLDDAGQPVLGARVHAVSRRTSLPHEAVSGAEGVFSLEGLGEGPFYVLASAEGMLPAVAPQVEAGPQPVRLKLTRARTLEVRVTRHGTPVAATVRLKADHLSRELRTQKGEPLRFSDLYPDRLVVTAEAEGLGSIPRTVELDALLTQVTLELEEAGTLLVTVVDATGQPVPAPELVLRTARGEVILQQKAQTGELVQLGPLASGDYVVEGRAEGFENTQLPARVKPGETQVELEMARATVISGQVMDEYGRPASRVSVLVQPTGETALADADGRFTVQVPTPGLYELHAHHSEWGGGKVKVTAPASGVELSLEPRAALEVTVSSAGRRVEGADVMLWIEREGIFRSDRPSGPDGVVPMRGLPAGKYWMVASHPDYLPSERQTVEVEDGQTVRVNVELPPGAALTGEVVDTQGAAVEGATVTVVPRGANPAMSDGRGHFEFRALRPDRAYHIEARHPAYDQEERVEGRAGGSPVRVVLKRREVFRGRVVGDDGAPVKRFRVDEHELSPPDGRFELALSKAGDRVVFAVDAPGYEPLLVDRPAAPELGDLVLKRAPSFSGLVRDESGAPVPDAMVSCDVCDDSAMSGPDGRFTLSAPPFVAQFTVSASKGRLSASESVPRGGSGAVVELTLRPATRLYGRVYQKDGTPAAGIALEGVHTDRGDPITVVTGQDGSYSVNVAPGTYRFALGEGRSFAGEPLLVAQVGGAEMRLDIGGVPGTGALTVLVKPERGRALWVVAGEVPASPPVAAELMRSRYAQLIYQPQSERVTLLGLPPGRYTLVWAHFHADTPEGPVVRAVEVPTSGEVSLLR
jgi:protocatechuate 3,4-dioxygenase beta subunit